MIPTLQDYLNIAPILVVSSVALLEVVIKILFKNSKKWFSYISISGLLVAIYFAVYNFGAISLSFNDMLFSGGFASFFEILFCIIGILTILQSESVNKIDEFNTAEYQILILFSIVGMMIMGSGADLITIFLGLELMSICFYILAGFARKHVAANEASLKYFLLGAFATGFLLYGIALIYGTTGTTNILAIARQYPMIFSIPLHVIGFILLLIGFAFKVALVPFHMWVPDVYEGSMTNVTGLMASGGKASAFAAFLLTFSIPLGVKNMELIQIISWLAVATMFVGNIFGLAQRNIKRMLGYSSIAHAGYLLVGLVSSNSLGNQGILFYLVIYSVTTICAFGVVSFVEDEYGKNLNIEDYSGLSVSNPFLAAVMSLCMFSLIGIPPLAGFVGKYYLFASAVQSNLIWIVVIGILTSIISLYYYLRIIVFMYFKEPKTENKIILSTESKISLIFSSVLILLLGIYPSLLLSVVEKFFKL